MQPPLYLLAMISKILKNITDSLSSRSRMNRALHDSKVNKALAIKDAHGLLQFKLLIPVGIEKLILHKNTSITFTGPLPQLYAQRAMALGFSVSGNAAHFESRIGEIFNSISIKVSKRFNNCKVTDLEISEVTGEITATLNKDSHVNCGYLEDYQN